MHAKDIGCPLFIRNLEGVDLLPAWQAMFDSRIGALARHMQRFSNRVGLTLGKMQLALPSTFQNIGSSGNKNAHIDMWSDAEIITSIL
jgi:hypothetical protein